ncbi:McrB family protein [Flammeovirga sp. EKP202]|uniref:McrB family protein n=1 Tax=Flammeovirga sp. EKP202 TaxID=2770592 RepID=UPI00165FDECD|nr:AAA family ATPase [Flammeovirga sp. EKP202]MBD0403245.1 AAA family ATPase [Flammeovirga sp. EKP202]
MEFFDWSKEAITLYKSKINKEYISNSPEVKYHYDTRKKIEYLVKQLNENLSSDLILNYTEYPQKQSGQGNSPRLKDYILRGFIPKNFHELIGKNVFIKFAFWGFNNDPHFNIDIDVNFSDRNNPYNLHRGQLQSSSWTKPLSQLPKNWDSLVKELSPILSEKIDEITTFLKPIKEMKDNKIDEYVSLIKSNKNLILTGAPGTGKTFLAKQIANAMNAEVEFVQFHPSYDYTDFVEGLRPIKNDGNSDIGFELRNGVFKEFCKNALLNIIDSSKTVEEVTKEQLIENELENILEDAIESNKNFELKNGNKFTVLEYNDSHIKVEVPKNEKTSDLLVNIKILKELLYQEDLQLLKVKDIKKFYKRDYHLQTDSYLFTFYEKVKTRLSESEESNLIDLTSNVPLKNFVLIIDEINRAEISKVFGELFYSIDTGYRGESGKVKTQYSNLQSDDDPFKGGIYVPENVYIIGTMNDIDRSVESFDFAMRRRFAWKEITASERINMWDGQIDKWKEDAEKVLRSLNTAIEDVSGLNSSYHIGPAYFLKLELYNGAFEKLWSNHIEGILIEYLRGLPNSQDELNNLKKAYDNSLNNA